MNAHRFDVLTSRLAAAGSRRGMLAALLGAPLAPMFGGSAVAESAAKRRGKNKRGKACGAGKPCPSETPCCQKGKCRPRCGDSCCGDCFVEILLNGQPNANNPVCCTASGGTICSPKVKAKRKKGKKKKKDNPADDLCCYPDQTCINGGCCCDGCEGAVICGGVCCPSEACCNGACCPAGQVCANTGSGLACVPATRSCGGGQPPCLSGEVCHGGVCCSGIRVCGDGMGNDVCCAADAYCEFPGLPIAECCPVNTICKGTYRGRRVRV